MAQISEKVRSLLADVLLEHPSASAREIADAFRVSEQFVRRQMRGLPLGSSGRLKSPDMVRKIETFASRKFGGRVEIVQIRLEHPALCVNGMEI